MKGKSLQVWLSEQEYKEFMSNYGAAITANKCTTKSDYIRQMLGVNGNQPPTKDSSQDKSNEIKEEMIDKEANKKASQLAVDFDKLEI